MINLILIYDEDTFYSEGMFYLVSQKYYTQEGCISDESTLQSCDDMGELSFSRKIYENDLYGKDYKKTIIAGGASIDISMESAESLHTIEGNVMPTPKELKDGLNKTFQYFQIVKIIKN